MIPELETLTGKWWVPTGDIDVGPFDTRVEADQHAQMILAARQDLAKNEKARNGY